MLSSAARFFVAMLYLNSVTSSSGGRRSCRIGEAYGTAKEEEPMILTDRSSSRTNHSTQAMREGTIHDTEEYDEMQDFFHPVLIHEACGQAL